MKKRRKALLHLMTPRYAQLCAAKGEAVVGSDGEGVPRLELAGVHAVVGLDERVPQVVDAELGQPLQRPVVEVQVVRVPAPPMTS